MSSHRGHGISSIRQISINLARSIYLEENRDRWVLYSEPYSEITGSE